MSHPSITYIKQLEHENILIIHDLQKIRTKWPSCSLARYKSDLGWVDITQSEKNSLKRSLKSKNASIEEERHQFLQKPSAFNFRAAWLDIEPF